MESSHSYPFDNSSSTGHHNETALHCPAADHGSIFSLPELDMLLATWCMVALIVCTVVFEFCLHKMEQQLRTHTHYLKILSRVYKELMILGFISFAILIVLQVTHLDDESVITLEFVHVWFFFIAVLYVLHVLLYMWLARRDKRRYDVANSMRIPDMLEGLRQINLLKEQDMLDQSFGARVRRKFHDITQFAFISSVASSIYQPRETQLYHQIQFHIVRSLFIRTYDLDGDFDFAKYLRRCMSKHITEQLDIQETSWCMLILFLFINAARVAIEQLYGNDNPIVTLWLFLVVPYLLLIVAFVLVIGIENAKKELMKKVGVTRAEDLEQALVRSRARLGGNNNKAHRASIMIPQRATITSIDQQAALNAYLPLLLQGLFPYNKPGLFPKTLEMIMLTQCFFIGLACIFHIRQAFHEFEAGIAAMYVIFTMLPHAIVLLVVAPHVMTTYVFVHSVGYVNKEVLAHVNSFMVESAELKSEIQTYLQHYALNARMTAADLFLRLSNEHSVIQVSNLQSALQKVNVDLNASQVSRLRRMINLQQNGQIDMREFLLFFFGSEGSAGLSLIPINQSTKGQLAMVTGTQTNKSIDKEVRTNAIIQQKREEAEQEANQARTLGDVVLMIGDESEDSMVQSVVQSSKQAAVRNDFHPNALHDPEVEPVMSKPNPAGGSPGSTHSIAISYAAPPAPMSRNHAASTSHHHAASPQHQPVQPVTPLPGLDLRRTGLGASKHQETNMFLSHTIGHTAHSTTHHNAHHTAHHTAHSQSVGAKAQAGVFGNELVNRMDFESCFYGSEALCQRCGKLVLVPLINVHVQSCKVKHLVLPGNVAISHTMNDDVLRGNRASSIPSVTSDDSGLARSTERAAKIAHKRNSSSHQAFDDIALSSKSENMRANARRSNLEPFAPLHVNPQAEEPIELDENGVPVAPPLVSIAAEVTAVNMHRRGSSVQIGPKKRDIRSKRTSIQYQ